MRTTATPASAGYQTLLVGLLGVNIGIVFLDRTAFGLLAPMIQPEFGLDNTQIGLITGALAIGWALSSFGLPRAADAPPDAPSGCWWWRRWSFRSPRSARDLPSDS
jgi:hypothetical protein